MRNLFAMMFGWFLLLFTVTSQQQLQKADTIPIPISIAYHNPVKTFQLSSDKKEKPSSSEDGYHKNRNIIVGVIIGVALILVLIK